METVKNYIKTRSVGYWLMAGAFVCSLVAMIMYFTCGVNEFTASLWGPLSAGFIVFFILTVAMLVYELRIAKYLTAAAGLYTLAMYIVFEINYLANVFTSIDPLDSSILAKFLVTVIFVAVAFGLATASAVMMKSGLAKEEKVKKEKKQVSAESCEEADA